jgi:hypothetical protein
MAAAQANRCLKELFVPKCRLMPCVARHCSIQIFSKRMIENIIVRVPDLQSRAIFA